MVPVKLGWVCLNQHGVARADVMAQDVRLFWSVVLEGKVAAPVSLAMRAAFAEARVVADSATNERLAKGSAAAGGDRLGRVRCRVTSPPGGAESSPGPAYHPTDTGRNSPFW